MNLNGYKTQKTHRNKQTFIKGNMGVPPWNGQSQSGYRASCSSTYVGIISSLVADTFNKTYYLRIL